MSVKLLVSVRSASEAVAALNGGADIIDVKDPDRGPLGRADWSAIAEIVRTVAQHRPGVVVSAALGELTDWMKDVPYPEMEFRQPELLKLGLAGALPGMSENSWRRSWEWVRGRIEQLLQIDIANPSSWVAVAYADFEQCGAPAPVDVLREGHRAGCSVLLLDTYRKDDSSLLDRIPEQALRELRLETTQKKMRLALAGQINLAILERVLAIRPDIVAVRGAVCDTGNRRSAICTKRVRSFSKLVKYEVASRVADLNALT